MKGQPLFQPPGSFIKHLNQVGLLSLKSPVLQDEYDTHFVDLTPLKLDTQVFTPFVIPSRFSGQHIVQAEAMAEFVPICRSQVRQENSYFLIILIGGRLVRNETLSSQLKKSKIAVMDRTVIEEVLNSSAVQAKYGILARPLVESLGCDALSPYQPGQPVHGARFFGRTRILQHILSRRDASFTLIGNRRIGKTSLLREIKHRLFIDDPSTRTADIYGTGLESTTEVLTTILHRLGLADPREKFDPGRPETQRFTETLYNAARTSKIAVFLDEIDPLLELDEIQGWEIMDTLRDTFDHPKCRLFLAGFRYTRYAKQKLSCPLYNFAESLEIKRLSREDAVEMITYPLHMLGIDIVNSDLPQAIYRETGGQPELIQIFGKGIVMHFVEHGVSPDTSALLEKVLQSEELEQRISQTFLANASPMEELLCYLLIRESYVSDASVEDFEFPAKVAYTVLKDQGYALDMHYLTNLLRNLELSGILTPAPGMKVRHYQFSVPQLARYCMSLDLDLCIVSALEKVATSSDQKEALFSTDTEELVRDV